MRSLSPEGRKVVRLVLADTAVVYIAFLEHADICTYTWGGSLQEPLVALPGRPQLCPCRG